MKHDRVALTHIALEANQVYGRRVVQAYRDVMFDWLIADDVI